MKKNTATVVIIIILIIAFIKCVALYSDIDVQKIYNKITERKTFNLLSNPDNNTIDEELMEFAKKNNIKLNIIHADDLEAIDMIEADPDEFDALWLSNSTWIYMLDGVTTLNSKSININPVVFGIKKSKAEELGFVNKEVKNKDIVNAIKDGKLKYVMSSVTKTNTGLIAYLGFLNALSGSPEILTSEMLQSKKLEQDLTSLFSGVQRVSGTDDFLKEMFLNSNDYEAVIATESSLIEINKQLENSKKEPLYLIYPVDGVALNDSPFAYIDSGQEKIDQFNKLQSFLLSKEVQSKLEHLGKRTWYGGVKTDADSSSFKKSWGIDTSKYLIPLKYPSKDVMQDAIALYIDVFRKPSATVFCLDYSGSMYGRGESELEDAMRYILDYDSAKEDKIQFSKKDKIFVIPFSTNVFETKTASDGRNTASLIADIEALSPTGSTNLYGCAQKALYELRNVSNNYTKTIILMTDGAANVGTFSDLYSTYANGERIPIYSIMFGSASSSQLEDISKLTNAKVFDGRYNLLEAFKEVRSYN